MLTLPAVYIVAQIIIYITRVSIYHFSNSGQETRLTASQFYSLSTWSSQTKLAVAKCYTVWSICFSRILQRTRSTDDQFTNHAVLGITAATCCIVCVMVLVILSVCGKCYSRITVCGTVIKRFAVGLSVATCCLSLLLHFILYVIFTQKKKSKTFAWIWGVPGQPLCICPGTSSTGRMPGSILGNAQSFLEA